MINKLFKICIAVGLLLLITTTVYADTRTIEEVLVVGPTRSSEVLVYKQLPFTEGDIWCEEYRKLAKKRIKALKIFNATELRVITEPVSDKTIRVVIRATDTSIYYSDIVEFAFMKTVDLRYQQFNHRLRHPL